MSIWSEKEFPLFLQRHIPQIGDLNSAAAKKRFMSLATINFVPPKTVLTQEKGRDREIKLVIDGSVEIFRKIRQSLDKHCTPNFEIPVTLSLEQRQGYKELINKFGDVILKKECTWEFPVMFGEESALLGIDQPYSYSTKSFTTVISFDCQKFLEMLKTEGRHSSLRSLQRMTVKKLEHLTSTATSRY